MKNIISELCRIAAKVERRKVKEEIEEKEVRWDKLKELVEMLSGQAGRGLGEIGEELLMRRRTLKKLEEASDLKSKDLERLLEK